MMGGRDVEVVEYPYDHGGRADIQLYASEAITECADAERIIASRSTLFRDCSVCYSAQ